MGKKAAAFLILVFALLFSQGTYAREVIEGWLVPVDIEVNGQLLKTDRPAYIDKGTTYAPLRAMANALGITQIIWDDHTQTVTLNWSENQLQLTVGNSVALFNNEIVPVGKSISLYQERTFVPLRFLAELMEAEVNWDSSLFVAQIKKEKLEMPEQLIETSYTKDDLLWMARIIEAESGGEPFVGKIAVGNVVMNRVIHQQFPNTVYDVIFDRTYSVQFQPVANHTIYNTPSLGSISAARYALRGTNVAGESLYFLNAKIATSFWIVNNRPYYTTFANHDFYL